MSADKLAADTGSDVGTVHHGGDHEPPMRERVSDRYTPSAASMVAVAAPDGGVSDAARAATMSAAHATIGTARLNRLMNPQLGADRRAPSAQTAETLPIGAAEAAHAPTGGQRLEKTVRESVEPVVGADLGHVRVHTGPAANAAAESLSARAFTSGRDIFLGPGENPTDTRLMAHEAAHVVEAGDIPGPRLYTPTGGDEGESRARSVADLAARAGPGPREGDPAPAGQLGLMASLADNKILHGLLRAVRDPAGFLEPFKATIGRWMSALPDTTAQQYQRFVAGRSAAAHGAQEQAQEPSHGQMVWEYVKLRLDYMREHWLSAIGDSLLEIFVPFVAEWRHLPGLFAGLYGAGRDLVAGRCSDAVDHGLAAAREASALAGTAFARLAIVAFIFGSIIGTPIIGEGAMVAIGLTALGVDAVIQGASIAKAWSNLDHPGRSEEKLDEDYSTIADSIVSLGVTLALLLIAFIGQKLGKALLARFPRVASSLESIRARLRAKLGIKTPRPAGPHLDVPGAPASAPEAAGYPGRAGLSAAEQRAFDRFVATEGRKGTLTPQYEARLKAMSADDLRQAVSRNMASKSRVEVSQAEREAALETNKSDPLDPKFSTPPRDDGGGVTSKFNKIAPDYEVPQAKKIAARTGEHITLFGDNYPGIDGVIGDPARPLQIKQPPPANGPAAVLEDAREAFAKASGHGYNQVEVHILAEDLTVSDVRAKFSEALDRGAFLDGKVVRRLVVWCKDGVFAPSGPALPTPPIHVTDDRRRPVAAP